MTFTQAIKEIRELAANDITEIVADFVNLKKTGNGMKGCCPFHEENTPSFHVSDQKGIYKCFGCGIGGDVIDFLMRIEGLEFHEVIYKLADRYHLTIDKSRNGSSTSKAKKAESVVPGIKEVRAEIRKSGNVFIALNGAPLDRLTTQAIVELSSPMSQEQAKTLIRYTSRCVFIPNKLGWESFKVSIAAALATDFTVLIWEDGSEHDWLHYILRTYEVSRSEIIQLLAILPDGITRSVYMAEYLNQTNLKKA